MHGVEWGKIQRLPQRITYHYCQEHSVQRAVKISVLSSRKSSELKTAPVQCLDLTPGHGNLLGQSFWEINSAWLGESWMLNYVQLNIICLMYS